jgi:hypothetical protein
VIIDLNITETERGGGGGLTSLSRMIRINSKGELGFAIPGV